MCGREDDAAAAAASRCLHLPADCISRGGGGGGGGSSGGGSGGGGSSSGGGGGGGGGAVVEVTNPAPAAVYFGRAPPRAQGVAATCPDGADAVS